MAEAPPEGEEAGQQLGGLARGQEGGQGEQGGGHHLEEAMLDLNTTGQNCLKHF